MNTKKSKNKIEYLSEDIIDEEFIKPMRYIHNFQMILAASRVDFRDRFVTVPSLLQRCYTILCVILAITVDYLIVHKYNFILFDNETIDFLSTCVTGLQSLTFICNIIHVRFFNGSANVRVFVKLQQIDRCMKLDRNKSITSLMVRANNVSLVAILIICGGLLVVAGANAKVSFWPYLGIVYSQFIFIIELVCCSNFIIYFYIRVCFMNSIIMNYLDRKKSQKILFSKQHPLRSYFPSKRYLRRLAAETHNFITSETDVYLKVILDGFSEFQEIYKFQVFIFYVKLVASCLLTFEFIVVALQNETMALWDTVTPSFFTLIDLLMAIILGIRCEVFIREVKQTKRLVITVMSVHFDGRLREKSKRMLKLIEETPPRFSVYDMWQMDANILLQLFMLLTSLIVTQLQFAFL